jgi:WD40 repeat protein
VLTKGHTNHILGLAFDKEASRLATAGADREVKVWDVASHEQDVTLGDKKTAFTAVDWTPDGRVLVAVTERGTGSAYTDLKVHNGEQRSESATERKLAAVTEMLTCVALAADGENRLCGWGRAEGCTSGRPIVASRRVSSSPEHRVAAAPTGSLRPANFRGRLE